MKRVKVLKNNVVTNQADFATQELADAFIAREEANKSFGKPERIIASNMLGDEDAVNAIETITEEVNGEEKVSYKFAAEYTIEISDVTAEINQKATNEQARKYLASTDWYVIRKEETGTAIPQEILDARVAARASIVE